MTHEVDILNFAADFCSGEQKIRIKRMHWKTQLSIPFYAYKATLEHEGEEIVGSGASFDEVSSIRKAVAELFERCCFVLEKSRKSSSGFAVQCDIQKAAFHAALELIERDLFMCFYMTKTPMLDYTDSANLQ